MQREKSGGGKKPPKTGWRPTKGGLAPVEERDAAGTDFTRRRNTAIKK